jgi:DNA modification methylase
MSEKKQISITPAKGRPMLTWVGKRPLSQVTVFPAQHVETFDPTDDARHGGDHWSDWPDHYPGGGLLFHGDNKEVMAHLLAGGFRGKVKLIYIDPPFDSGANYVRRVRLRGATGTTHINGEGYTLGEQIQYQDIWVNDNYLQFMYERLLLFKELMADNGSIFVHCDHRKNAQLRLLLDEVFGPDGFVNEIIWRSTTFTGSSKAISKRYPTNHNTIYWYKKGQEYVFNKVWEEYRHEYLDRFENPDDDPNGPWQSVSLKTYSQGTFNLLRQEGRLIEPRTPGAGWRYKFYLRDAKGRALETLWLDSPATGVATEEPPGQGTEVIPSVWLDINMANSMADERTGYPTEKPDELLARIISATSEPGDTVLDGFVGSGTTAVVAQRLGRHFIACDINKGAVQTTSKRLQTVIQEQSAARAKNGQRRLVESDRQPTPAQLSFSVWRVNDYDLQIQHNEAINLVCEHLGVQRALSDSFFDGTLGRNLVKIVPFNHPLSPLDLDEIRRELDARPEEDRNIAVVCLGRELAAAAWIEDWNRLRKGDNAVNRIEVIEMRTDPRYGRFIEHKPASARVKITRQDGQISVQIEDFISPTIIERLTQQAGILRPEIEDWRAMVDCVMIDPVSDGQVFKMVLCDAPAKKENLVAGTYTLPAPDGATTVAVKIIDMLGEEVLVTERV